MRDYADKLRLYGLRVVVGFLGSTMVFFARTCPGLMVS